MCKRHGQYSIISRFEPEVAPLTNIIFYSWQSDSPAKTNRNFIEGVLKRVIKEIGQEEGDVEVAERPLQLDRDTKGVSGSPSIVEAILGKIENCGVFVPDLTFVGETPAGRPLQNPNVLIEYGWALSHIGDARIVAVMNTAYGEPGKDSMPFDLVHKRWPIRYTLEEGADASERKRVKDGLVHELKGAILAALSEVPALPTPEAPRLQPKSRKTSFLDDGDLVGILPPFGSIKEPREIHWKDSPQTALRLYPEGSTQSFRRHTLSELFDGRMVSLLAPRPISTWDFANDHGFVIIEGTGEVDQHHAQVVTQITTWGEIWAIDAKTYESPNHSIHYPEMFFSEKLSHYLYILRELLGLEGHVTIEAGYSGIRGRPCYRAPVAAAMHYDDHGQVWGNATSDEFITQIKHVSLAVDQHENLLVDRSKVKWREFASTESENKFVDGYVKLLPFFEDFWDHQGMKRPEFLPRLKEE